jgi:hypothetical protein
MLEEIGIENRDLKVVASLMSQWYTAYETLCRQNVVNEVRERLRQDQQTAFLIHKRVIQEDR